MKFSMDHYFDTPADKIIDMLKAGEDLCRMEDLPNVSSRKVIERRREGKKMFSRIEWNVHGQIPKIAQKILRPEMLTFVEESVWDDDDTTFRTKIIPHYLKDKLSCNTTSQWSAAGDGKARRRFGGELVLNIPIVGPVAEKTIVDYLKKNNDKNAVIVRKFLQEKFGAAG